MLAFFLRRPYAAIAAAVLLGVGVLLMPWPWSLFPASLLGILLAIRLLDRWNAPAWGHPWRLTHPLKNIHHLTIDGELLLSPRRVVEVQLPFESLPAPRMGSSTLLWASAATVTCSLAPEEDQPAILAAVRPLGFDRDKFLARCPILREITFQGVEGYVVRDGNGSRAYFTGDAHVLLQCCTRVWDQTERDLTPDDLQHSMEPGGMRGYAMAEVKDGTPAPLTYLGALKVSRSCMEDSPLLRQLAHSYNYTITPPASAPELADTMQSLSLTAEIPAHTLHVSTQPTGENTFTVEDPQALAAQLRQGRSRAIAEEYRLYGLILCHAMLLIAAKPLNVPAWMLLAAGLLLLPVHLLAPLPTNNFSAPLWRQIFSMVCMELWASLWAGVMSSFLQYAAPDVFSACGMLAFIAGAATLGMIPPLHARSAAGAWKLILPVAVLSLAAVWLLTGPGVIPGAFSLLAGALLGAVTALVQYPAICL